jgi:hypothetical protein
MRKSDLEKMRRPGAEVGGTIAGTIGGTIAGTIGGTAAGGAEERPALLRSLD